MPVYMIRAGDPRDDGHGQHVGGSACRSASIVPDRPLSPLRMVSVSDLKRAGHTTFFFVPRAS